MPTYPLATLAPTIDAAGISAPTYSDVLASLQASFRSIYGNDAYLAADSQDGQLLAIFAKAISDSNDAVIAAYGARSPVSAVGEGLSGVVKINGLARAVATKSTVSVTITGAPTTLITAGQVRDTSGQLWDLPATVTIPVGGSVSVTATAHLAGALRAGAGTVTEIATPVYGWTAVTNPSAAAIGAPVETDAQLRRRQAASVTFSSVGPLGAIQAALLAVPGVTSVRIYENTDASIDAAGINPHSIAIVVTGGTDAAVAGAIMRSRSAGVGMQGSTTIVLTDDVGIVQSVKFSRPTPVTCQVRVTLHGLLNYTTGVGDLIKAYVSDEINKLRPGDTVYWGRMFQPALLPARPDVNGTYDINNIELQRVAGVWGSADLTMAYNEQAVSSVADIIIVAT